MNQIDYTPIGSLTVELAVANLLVSGTVSTVRIWIRAITVVADPTTFISSNSLESEVLSRAGLDEEMEFASYTLISSTTYSDHYEYVVDATVSS